MDAPKKAQTATPDVVEVAVTTEHIGDRVRVMIEGEESMVDRFEFALPAGRCFRFSKIIRLETE